jgi:hypothetical protein
MLTHRARLGHFVWAHTGHGQTSLPSNLSHFKRHRPNILRQPNVTLEYTRHSIRMSNWRWVLPYANSIWCTLAV